MARKKSAEDKPKRSTAKPTAFEKIEDGLNEVLEGVRKRGRPTSYTVEEADRICTWVASGKSIVSYCKQLATPNYATITDWRVAYPDFDAKIARAREDQAEFLADELVEISDNQELDPNARRVMIDTRKWIASKLKPRIYGDKIQADVTGKVTLEQLVLGSYKTEGQS
jgi:hypothetical protein